MPRWSGTQLIEKLRARSLARLYLISASGPAEDVAAAADGFLLKPFDPESLTRLIEEQEASSKPAPPKGLDPEEQVVNPGTLAQLREMMPEAALRQIYEAIIADVGKRTTLLEVAVAKGDWPETRRIGHAIKGGGSMAGATQIARLGHLIEAGGLEPSTINHVDDSLAIIHDLRAAAVNLQRILEAEFTA
jgi:HPt (histidine-containing phosphotransfer) domain-containing protein